MLAALNGPSPPAERAQHRSDSDGCGTPGSERTGFRGRPLAGAAAQRRPAGDVAPGLPHRGHRRGCRGADSGATPPYRALRARDRLYVEYDSGERELYDLVADPDQLDNLAAETNPRLIDSLSTRLTELTRCEGPGSRVAEDAALDRFGST
jgi:hypothetical protein